MTTQLCFNQSEAVELHGPHGLYIKPIAKLNISVTLPQMKTEGKSISNWEVMEKLKRMAKPDSFLVLRVSKSSLEFLRFEAEVEAKSLIKVLILRLDGKVIKLSGFPEPLKVRAAEAKINFPNRHDWDSFFRDAKNMNESNHGERPDTIKLEGLPCKWFSSTAEPDKPSELIIKKIFELFGEIRNVDVPMLDPYRHESQVIGGNFRTFSSFSTLTFEVYVQYSEYIGFVKAMDALKGMKLLKKEMSSEEGKEGKAYTADIKVDFDKTRHMSAKAIRKREKERTRLIELEKAREDQKRLEREEEEKKLEDERRRKEQEELYKKQRKQAKLTRREERRQQREKKRRRIQEEKKRIKQEAELQRRIALEERKLLIALRQLESIRLLTELLERVKVVRQQEEVQQRLEELERERLRQLEEEKQRKEEEEKMKLKEEARKRRELRRREAHLKQRLTKNLKTREEQEQEKKREGLRQKIRGRSRLKSAVIQDTKFRLDDYEEYDRRKREKNKKPKIRSAVVYKTR
ncbi:A-kinase anchor protein 17A-like [Asterias rubens]|uniref:A-kinase anchor protein 17A-like n=1 Tax=Asterias rubens TaxID=7604 RepID=UPI001454F60A|nr:A-kinase anchor protein 17A-like [Asterias rubens]XP_033632136.1 A-kinase anchor protein 17A-like [Asterias rubens]